MNQFLSSPPSSIADFVKSPTTFGTLPHPEGPSSPGSPLPEFSSCPQCGKQYPWRLELAARKVRCTCEAKFRMPPSAEAEATLLEIAPGQPPPMGAEAPAAPEPAPALDDPGAAEDDPLELDLDLDLDLDSPPEAGAGAEADASETETFELDRSSGPAAAPPQTPEHCPECSEPLKPGAVLCIQCGHDLRAGDNVVTTVETGAEEEAEDPATPRERRRSEREKEEAEALRRRVLLEDWLYPLCVLTAGLLLMLVNIFLFVPRYEAMIEAQHQARVEKLQEELERAGLGQQAGAGGAGIQVNPPAILQDPVWLRRLRQIGDFLLTLILQLPLAFLALLLVVKLFGVAFQGLVPLILKLLAILCITGGVYDCLSTLMELLTEGHGGLAGFLTMTMWLGTFWMFGMWLLELDVIEVLVFSILNLLLGLFVVFFVGMMLLG